MLSPQDSHAEDSGPPQSPRRWQFSLSALFGTLLLLCLPFALWGALLRADEGEQFVFMLLCIAAPTGVLVLAATLFSLGRALRNWRPSRRKDSADDETPF